MGDEGSPRETEAKLVVCAPAPHAILDEIAALGEIAGYILGAFVDYRTQDQFLDTRERALSQRRLALRIRRSGAQQWLTLKGPARLTEHGLERLEIERPYSLTAWTEMRAALAAQGVELPLPAAGATDPPSTLRHLGLEVVERYRVRRRRCDVLRVATRVAELALDVLCLELGGRELRLYELEIEQKHPQGAAALADVSQALLARYPAALRRWWHSKLAVALALRALAAQGRLAHWGDAPAALYGQIDAYLTAEGTARG